MNNSISIKYPEGAINTDTINAFKELLLNYNITNLKEAQFIYHSIHNPKEVLEFYKPIFKNININSFINHKSLPYEHNNFIFSDKSNLNIIKDFMSDIDYLHALGLLANSYLYANKWESKPDAMFNLNNKQELLYNNYLERLDLEHTLINELNYIKTFINQCKLNMPIITTSKKYTPSNIYKYLIMGNLEESVLSVNLLINSDVDIEKIIYIANIFDFYFNHGK